MERQKERVVDAVMKVFSPRALVLRNDTPVRTEEGLPCYTEVAVGTVNREAVVPSARSGSSSTSWAAIRRASTSTSGTTDC
jgi:23S rRNA (cytosine1962-C5)-methyltransferase